MKKDSTRRNGRKINFKKRIYLLLLMPAACLITLIAQNNIFFAEQICALHIYKWFSVPISTITSLVPFSVGELAICILPLLAIYLLIRFVVRLKRGRGQRKKIACDFLLNLSCLVSVVLFAYVILCGTNYYRHSFAYYSGLTIQDSTEDELYDLCIELADTANSLREQTAQAEDGTFKLSSDLDETGEKARDAMNVLSEQYPVLSGWNAKPKGIFFSKFMSMTETTGIFFNFVMEANVNTDVPEYSIPSTMCHELSHLRGFMREDEANYISYLACMASGDLDLQYSGVMEALILSGNALYKQNCERYYEVSATYSDAVRADLVANNEYWAQYKDKVVSTVSNKVNDTYLKANQQTDGVQSYGRMVDLLLAEYRTRMENE